MKNEMKIEVRADGSLHIEGYVNAIERDSNPLNARGVGECVEQVKAGAFGMALRSAPNVDMLLNHDKGHKLAATSEGTLELREDSIGLKAAADITDEFVISKAKSGLLRGWSFGFRATDQEIEERSGKIPRRIIKSMDLFEVSVIDDTHTPCYNGCSLEFRADMVDDYEIRSTGNDTVVGAESATATEGTAADTSEERGVSAELLRMQLELMEMEARYNHYHDPHNGRFASGGGVGGGIYIDAGYKSDVQKYGKTIAQLKRTGGHLADKEMENYQKQAERTAKGLRDVIDSQYKDRHMKDAAELLRTAKTPKEFKEAKRVARHYANSINTLERQVQKLDNESWNIQTARYERQRLFANISGRNTVKLSSVKQIKGQQSFF